MLNSRLAVIGFALILPIHGQKKATHPTGHERNTTTQTKVPAPSSPGVVNVINQEAAHQEGDGTADHSKSYLARLVSPENLPNVGLFVVGVVGIIIAICTLRKIRNQAELMERQATIMDRQANLMELGYTQWIELHNWKTELHQEANILRVRVDVLNPTSFPLTLREGSVKFSSIPVGSNQVFITPQFLPPKVPYTIKANVFLTDDQIVEFNSTFLNFSVEGCFSYVGPLGEAFLDTWPVRGILGCTPKKTWYQAIMPIKPEPTRSTQKPKDEPAN